MKKRHSMTILPLCLVFVLLATTTWGSAAFSGVEVDCDPCIDRESYKVKVIAHGTEGDGFWQGMQAGSDMRVKLEFDLYESYSDKQMAEDIMHVAELAAKKDPSAPDALVVTIPSEEVEGAIRYALEYIPIFGMNSGYDRAETVGLLGFVAMDGTYTVRKWGRPAGTETQETFDGLLLFRLSTTLACFFKYEVIS